MGRGRPRHPRVLQEGCCVCTWIASQPRKRRKGGDGWQSPWPILSVLTLCHTRPMCLLYTHQLATLMTLCGIPCDYSHAHLSKFRLKEEHGFARGHIAHGWQSWDSGTAQCQGWCSYPPQLTVSLCRTVWTGTQRTEHPGWNGSGKMSSRGACWGPGTNDGAERGREERHVGSTVSTYGTQTPHPPLPALPASDHCMQMFDVVGLNIAPTSQMSKWRPGEVEKLAVAQHGRGSGGRSGF